MNKFEKLAKLDVAYQLIAQVHSDLCNDRKRKDSVIEKALDLTRDVLMLKSLIEKKIPDDTETRIANTTAHRLGESIRDELFEMTENGKTQFTFDEVEHIVCGSVDKIWEE